MPENELNIAMVFDKIERHYRDALGDFGFHDPDNQPDPRGVLGWGTRAVRKFAMHKLRKELPGQYGQWHVIDAADFYEGRITRYAQAVLAIVPKSRLQDKGDHFAAIDPSSLAERFEKAQHLAPGQKLSSKFPYRDQSSISIGTAFVIDSQFVMTAGHNVTVERVSDDGGTMEVDIEDCYLVRGYHNVDGFDLSRIPKSQVYQPSVVKMVDDFRGDWALLQVQQHLPETLALDDTGVKKNYRLYCMGHPLGLPIKLAYSARVIRMLDPYRFLANLDTFAGNSGSPVINPVTDTVVGILVAGEPDFTAQGNTTEFNVSTKLDDGSEGAEVVMSIKAIHKELKALIEKHRIEALPVNATPTNS